MTDIFTPALMGLIEGLTEFLPVSSTGHLILAEHLLAWQSPPGKAFEVVIQLGAILAVCVVYFARLWRVARGMLTDRGARNFVVAVLLAFLPAMVAGLLLHDVIKALLFNPTVVAWALLVGGIAIVVIEKFFDPRDEFFEVEDFSPKLALQIGLIQLLSLIPGVSRSGATIMGATLLGVSRKAAAEFSFFLAIPVMMGAAALSLYKSWHELSAADLDIIGIGFVAAFVSALLVVRYFVGFVSRHGFAPFGWYRIAAGAVMLFLLAA
jgi:undecaprenyl-diphosphatase